MKTIKVIDLLTMIANKSMKIPTMIKCEGSIYKFKGEDYYCNESNSWLLTQDESLFTSLNDEVEIIEDKPSKIEEIETKRDLIKAPSTGNFAYSVSMPQKIMIKKINELVREVNNLLKKD